MVNQKGVITVELYNKEFNRYSKSEYVIISRDEYNRVTKQFLACKIVYSKNVKPYIVPIKVSGLRRNSKVNTLNIHTIKHQPLPSWLQKKEYSVFFLSSSEKCALIVL